MLTSIAALNKSKMELIEGMKYALCKRNTMVVARRQLRLRPFLDTNSYL
jgi:hypothetical protein